MESAVSVITELGFPIAAALGLGIFVWKLINRIIDGMETKLDTVDDKVAATLDAQHGMIVALIDRVRAVDNQTIRQDILLKTLLGVPDLIEIDKVAKAERDDQRKD